MQSYYRQTFQSASYELTPVQSVTTPSGHYPHTHHFTPTNRPDSGPRLAHLQPLPLPQPITTALPLASTSYSRSHDSASGSPAEGAFQLPDELSPKGDTVEPAGVILQAGSAGQKLQAAQQTQPKRAYRQRRKDPSCDACRERKVKCDASESSSCTECTNRKVRCQFTKETNRRMSSIKQVQDLEKQLLSTKQQLQQLRSGLLKPDNVAVFDADSSGQMAVKLPEIGYRPPRRSNALLAQDLSEVRTNLRDYGRGILKIPRPYRQLGSASLLTGECPPLLPKNLADLLLAQYYACVHTLLPVIHWPSFVSEYESVYRKGSLVGMRREWASVLFGIFACGCLHTLERDKVRNGKEFISIACSIIDVWQDDFTLDQVRAALLVSLFLYEVNSKSASWAWIGTGVRIAQELGLHIESGPWPTVEGEMRRRVWWGMYAWDRLVVLEMGKPIFINDHDCDVNLPCPVDDQYISDAGPFPEARAETTPLLATIHVVRSLGQLSKTLKSEIISPATLETFERHFNACLGTFPAEYQPDSDQYLDPRSLAPIIYLQNARIFLHRHNMSPFCPHDVRSAALKHCLTTSIDTTRLLSRCMQQPPPGRTPRPQHWKSILGPSASTILCTHIWRCELLLLFSQEYAAALTCVQASSVIGDSRAANAACGRYLAFFLRFMLDRRRRAGADFDHDEEMLAYVSGDMQGTTDSSWIWHGSETGAQLDELSPHLTTNAAPLSPPGVRGSWVSVPTPDLEWEGWDWVERTVQYLLAEKQQQQPDRMDAEFAIRPMKINTTQATATATATVPEESFPSSSLITSPDMAAARDEMMTFRKSSSAQSRMTIASIIGAGEGNPGPRNRPPRS